jgi:hypothetical protein
LWSLFLISINKELFLEEGLWRKSFRITNSVII